MNGLLKAIVVSLFVLGVGNLLLACGNKSGEDVDADGAAEVNDDVDALGDVDADGGGDVDLDVDDDGDAEGDAGHMVAFNIEFRNMAEEPVTGVEVCWYEDDTVPCQTSAGPEGRAMIYLPADTSGALQVSHPDYQDYLHFHTTSSEHLWEEWTFLVSTQAENDGFYALLGLTDDPAAEGIMVVTEFTSPDAGLGATVSIDPVAGDGPFYLNYSNLPDVSLTSASESAVAFVVNVAPGEYDVNVVLDSAPCYAAGLSNGPAPVEVVAGLGSIIAFSCR